MAKIKFLYGTDFHGNPRKYRDILNFAIEYHYPLIHLGADILPKGSGILEEQKFFIKNGLKNFYSECSKNGIKVLALFGNDDIYSRKKYFREYGSLLDEQPYEENGFKFIGYPYVLDYPFGLKTACKLDYKGWKCPDAYLGKSVDIGPTGGFQEIINVKEYFEKKSTIEDDLKKIHANNKTIMGGHLPPWATNLCVCLGGRRVGSKSIYEWILREQPLLYLCGHIHESYDITKEWKILIGKTLVIQPGQHEENTYFATIDISDNDVEAYHVVIPHR